MKATRMYEITELRTENKKVFQMSDGTMEAVYYPKRNIEENEGISPASLDIMESGTSCLETFGWDGDSLYMEDTHILGSGGAGIKNRMYMNLWLQEPVKNPRIKKATLVFKQSGNGILASIEAPKIGLYKTLGDVCYGEEIPEYDTNLIDYAKMQTDNPQEDVTYTFDITKLTDKMSNEGSYYGSLVLKLLDENANSVAHIALHGSNSAINPPEICVTYESGYGVNTSYRSHTHAIGGFGQGSIDLACGNLMFETVDFAWQGKRKPVTLNHFYNSILGGYPYTRSTAIGLKTADFSAMKLGYGWKLNVMQSVMPATFCHEGAAYNGYVYVNGNGEDIYLAKDDEATAKAGQDVYMDVDGDGEEYYPATRTMKVSGEEYLFDANGRLIREKDSYGNHMDITYTNNRITKVTDGIGREFNFVYNTGGYLVSITAPDESVISYSYTGNLLSEITLPDGRKSKLTYSANKPESVVLQDKNGNNIYKVQYGYYNNRVSSITEYGVENGAFVAGESSAYTYNIEANSTVMTTTLLADTEVGETEDTKIQTVYSFDDESNVLSEYAFSKDMDKTGVTSGTSGINPYAKEGGTGVAANIHNLLTNHNFADLINWTAMEGNNSTTNILSRLNEKQAKFGRRYLSLTSTVETAADNGVYQDCGELAEGEYTFSLYARVAGTFTGTNAGTFIRVVDEENNILAESERLTKADSAYIRLITPFTLETKQNVKVCVLINGKGTAYVDGAQLEDNPFANDYNMLTNGNFEKGTAEWTVNGATATTESCFNGSRSLTMTGDVDGQKNASQEVAVCREKGIRETFTLSGWAKGYGIVNHERTDLPDSQFRLRAVITFNDVVSGREKTETHVAEFHPATEEWQFASVQFSKEQYRTVKNIIVYCDYDYNFGKVYFDNVQLVRTELETGLTAEDFGDYTESDTESTDDSSVSESPQEDSAEPFAEVEDAYGNVLTETTFTDGEFGTIYTAKEFSAGNGNDLVKEIDARGNGVTYTVDPVTSRNSEVTDALGNRVAYEYDMDGNITRAISKKADGTEISRVAYAYNGQETMTEIARGDGMKYALEYDANNKIESIGINGKAEKLVTYTYKPGNGRIKGIAYANGDRMEVAYNQVGKLTGEKWYNGSNVLTHNYAYVYDGSGNIVRSQDLTGKKEYTYTYEGSKLVCLREYDFTTDSAGNIVSKSLLSSLIYVYNEEGKVSRKRFIPAEGEEVVLYCEETESGNVVKFEAGGQTVTSHSKTDSFGRKVFDEIQLGTGYLSRQFEYHLGEVTDCHRTNGKIKSTAITQLVKEILLSDGRKLAYEYDAEAHITSVTETYTENGTTITNVTAYTYDALGQLLTESVNGQVINAMTYDGYGNILTKNQVAYTYGDTAWKDKLTAVGSQSIIYDAQGNPTSYLGHTLTWEKGRQLKTFDGNSYAYNASGQRVSKTVNGVTHTYLLDGSRILRESWGDNTLIPLYDNENMVCGILYNNEPYYFMENLQGDIIAIANKDAEIVVRYSYDAWGVCTTQFDNSGVNIGTVNPFRYRGYYFDVETGLYYLGSRYYDAEVGRFVNADKIMGATEDISTYALFTYCGNNPVERYDQGGMRWITKLVKLRISIHLANLLMVMLGINTAVLGKWFLDMYVDDFGIYHAKFDCWQHIFGYNDFYDLAFRFFTSMKRRKFSFQNSITKRKQIIWIWKGNYINLGAGAELGLYYGGPRHWKVDKKQVLGVRLRLRYKGRLIISYAAKTWWLTGFNPKYLNVRADDLKATFVVTFYSYGLYNGFTKGTDEDTKKPVEDYWTLRNERKRATFEF